MGTKVFDSGRDFTPCPEGNHVGRVYRVIFMGTVPTEFKGVVSHKPQIVLGFELPSELMEDGKPYVISTMPITASMNNKAAFKKLVRGIVEINDENEKEFDPQTLIGKTCLVNVVHTDGKDGNTYANVVGCTPIPKGMEVPPAVNDPFIFDVNESPLEDVLKLPEFLAKKVESTPEYKARSSK